MLKGAIIGFGQVAEKAHVPAWARARDAVISAVAESRRDRRDAAKKALPDAALYEDAGAMLRAGKLDFVDIATPPSLHVPQAELALRHGCHVLCEKPLTLERAAFERLRAQAAGAERALFTVHNWKQAPLFQKLHELLREQAVGRVRHVELHTLRDQPAPTAAAPGNQDNWRLDVNAAGGGILVDHGWHCVYLLAWLLDAAPLSARGKLRFPKGGQVEEEASCLLEFPQATALAFLTWRATRRSHWGVVYGEKGQIDMLDNSLLLRRGDDPPQTFLFAEPLSRASAHPDWFHAMLPEFLEAVRGGEARERNLAEAEACVSVLEAMYGQRPGASRSPLVRSPTPKAKPMRGARKPAPKKAAAVTL